MKIDPICKIARNRDMKPPFDSYLLYSLHIKQHTTF